MTRLERRDQKEPRKVLQDGFIVHHHPICSRGPEIPLSVPPSILSAGGKYHRRILFRRSS